MKNLICGLILAGLAFSKAYSQKKNEFILVKEAEQIAIYERWVQIPKSDPAVTAREVKGEFTFNSSIREAIQLLQDEQKIQKWQSHVSEFKVYKEKDSTRWREYSYHDIPWPVSDQDHFLEYKILKSSPFEVYIEFESKPDQTLAPVRDGVTRMQLSGSWTFTRLTDSKIKATYRIQSTPLGIPKFITDPIIRNNMMTTIQEFIALLDNNNN